MLKYDLTDLGYKYKGAATVPSKEIKLNGWDVINIPQDIDDEKVKNDVTVFLNGVYAIEIPTSYICNLRCEYCYIDDPRMKSKKVSKDSVTKILIELEKMFPNYKKDADIGDHKRYFSPWGAEPFMNVETLEAIYEFAHDTYGANKYLINTSTNGTIWNDRIDKFLENLLKDDAMKRIQVSLDGPPEIQNKNRPYLNGKPSFDDVAEFVDNLYRLSKDLKINRRLHTICSTIHLQGDNFDKEWVAAAEFFSEPNKWWTTAPYLPMRMSGEDMYGEDEVNRFINSQRLLVDVVKKRAEQDIPLLDFYSSRLFASMDCKSRNSFPYCSAMNSQMGIDIDGSMYPCHGAMTTPKYKPWLWFGNIFDKTIDYSKLVRNLHYQYNTWNRGKCVSCEIYHYTSGSICWSCAPHNLAVSGEPTIDNIMKCKAYTESFKYWVEISKMYIENPILDEIKMDNIIKSKNMIKAINNTDMHYDRNYDGIISGSIEKTCNCDIEIKDMYYVDDWWVFDDFFEMTSKK